MYLLCKIFCIPIASITVNCQDEGAYCGLLRALPWPMPLTNSSSLLPIFFADNINVSTYGVSALERPPKQAERLNFSVSLSGSLYFEILVGLDEDNVTGVPTPCITLTNQTLSDLKTPQKLNGTFVAYSSGSIPTRCYNCGLASHTPLTRILPGCRERVSTAAPHFTTCQSGLNHHWLTLGFFTPHDLGFQGWPNFSSSDYKYLSSPYRNDSTYESLLQTGDFNGTQYFT